jgi:hypothetical protein
LRSHENDIYISVIEETYAKIRNPTHNRGNYISRKCTVTKFFAKMCQLFSCKNLHKILLFILHTVPAIFVKTRRKSQNLLIFANIFFIFVNFGSYVSNFRETAEKLKQKFSFQHWSQIEKLRCFSRYLSRLKLEV